VTSGPLSPRALNRATLERQLLLRRAALTAKEAVGHLAGLQAQAPLAPYLGLWTRLAGFGHQHLKDLLTERSVVRAHLLRNTVHLVTAEDFVSFRPLVQPLMERGLARTLPIRAGGRHLGGVDLTELAQVAATLLGETALTRRQLAERLAPRWPDHDPASLANAATHLLPLVQAPPRGLWGSAGQATFVLAAAWLDGRSLVPPDPARAVEQLVLRYLTAYGPARVADIQTWSGLSRLREVTERLGAQLRVFAGSDGGQLLDLPDAPRPGPDVPAPPRFLPAYDNLLLSFAERSRVIPHRRPVPLPPGHGASSGTLLIDGFWQADWKIIKGQRETVLQIEPFVSLTAADRDAIAAEGERLLDVAGPASGRDVRFARSVRLK
jgi:hypothetical protein